MGIKEKLKGLDIRLVNLSNELEISRPTLNNYIEKYERGEIIASERHQLIFEELFGGEVETNEQFMSILSSFHNLLERDRVMGTLDLDLGTTDLITSIFDGMKHDVMGAEYDEEVYKMINILIRGYKSEHVFKKFARYFLVLNGVLGLDEIIDDEKPFISNCYKIMSMARNNELETDILYFSKFIERVTEIDEIKKEESDKMKDDIIKKQIKQKLDAKINEQLQLGLDLNEIDIDDLLSSINFSKK